MKICVLGANGMLGQDLVAQWISSGFDVISMDLPDVDITKKDDLHYQLNAILPVDIIVNCAAYTNVDGAETEQSIATSVNGQAVGYIASFCSDHDIPLVHFSTDYVFDGSLDRPYLETDTPHPINTYGRSKLDAETAIISQLDQYYIFRIQWLYGKNGQHFIGRMEQLMAEREELNIVSDQLGAPTWTVDVAKIVVDAIESKIPYGIYHCVNDGYGSWADVAKFLAEYWDRSCTITPIPSKDYPTPAKRPLNGRLDCSKLETALGFRPRNWKEALTEYLS